LRNEIKLRFGLILFDVISVLVSKISTRLGYAYHKWYKYRGQVIGARVKKDLENQRHTDQEEENDREV
jgi:hypothetical protein